MKKTLVEVANLETYVSSDGKKIVVDNTMILTPGAKDELSKRGIAIVHDGGCTAHGAQGSGYASTPDELLLAVAAMVKEQFGVTDPATLKAISSQAVKILKENV